MHRALSAIITNPLPNHPRYLTKHPPVLFESRCSINPSFIRMAKCLPIAATLLPDISAIPLRRMPEFKRIIVYVALTLSFIVSLASLLLYWVLEAPIPLHQPQSCFSVLSHPIGHLSKQIKWLGNQTRRSLHSPPFGAYSVF